MSNGSEPDELNFHYNREQRLRNSPETVQRMYSGEIFGPKRGIVKIFFTNRGMSIMFLCLVFIAVSTLFFNFFGKDSHETSIDGISIVISALSFKDSVYVKIKMDANSKTAKPQPVSIIISGYDADGNQVSIQEINGIYDGNQQVFQIAISDYDILNVGAQIEMSGKKESIIKTVDR